MKHPGSQSPAQPRLATYVAFHARRRPHHIAVLANGTPVTYAALHQNLQAIIQTIRNLAPPPGGTAAIGLDDLYTQLLLVFGCEALGLVTASFRPSEAADASTAALLAGASIVFTAPTAAVRHPNIQEISPSWLAAALAAPPSPPPNLPPANPADGEAIFRSSGTTGAPKRMLISHAAMRARLAAQRNKHRGLNRNARFLATMHFAVGSIYMAAANTLRLGATFQVHTPQPGDPPRPLETLLATYDPTHITILPFQLRSLLAALPDSAAPLLPNLTIQTIGAKLSAGLRRATLQKLAGHIHENYGTNETGQIGTVQEDGLVHLFPGVEAEILAADGAPAPPGEPGPLHIRTPGMVSAYLNDPETTAEMFLPTASGQTAFRPGDIGVRTDPGTIKLLGRRADLLNLGGTKLPAADLEAKLLACPLLQDVAVIQPAAGAASTPIIVCAVPKPHTKRASLEQSLIPLMPFPFSIRILAQIPRTTEGKIQRNRLQVALLTK